VGHGCILCTNLPGALNSLSYLEGGRCSGEATAPTSGAYGHLEGATVHGSIIICTNLQLAKLGRCLVTPFMVFSGLEWCK
jgi:hypothetical protein